MTGNQHDPPTLEEVRSVLWEKYQQLLMENAVLTGTLTGALEALESLDSNGFSGTIAGIRKILKETGNAG